MNSLDRNFISSAIMKHLTKSDLKIRLFTPDDIDFVISRQIKLQKSSMGSTPKNGKPM